MKTQPTPPHGCHRTYRNSLTRIVAFVALFALIGIPLFSSSSSSSPSDGARAVPGNTRETPTPVGHDSILVGEKFAPATAPTMFPLIMPQLQAETITIYQSDCMTAQASFTLGQAICVKLTNAPLGSRPTQILRRLSIVSPYGVVVAKADVTSDPQILNFTLPTDPTTVYGLVTGDNRGTWKVSSLAPATGVVKISASFQVTDPANAVADLSLKAYVFGSGQVPAGDDVTFAVYVINYGPDEAANVAVTADVPANTTFASEIHTNLDFTCVNPAGGGTGTSTCTIASLARGSTVLFDFTYHVSSGASPGLPILHTSNISTTTAQRSTGATTANAVAFVTEADAAEECTVTCPTDKIVTADTTQGGQPGKFVTYSAASVFGSCGSISNSPASGSFFTVTGSPHTVTSTSTAGPSCTFTVTVLSSTPPTITCPASMTVTAAPGEDHATVDPGMPTHTASGGGETVVGVRSDGTPAVYDDDGNVVTPAVVVPLTDPYPVGTTGILWTVTDAGGRSASCSQTITVQATVRDPLTITCPANIITTAPSGNCETTVTLNDPTTNPSDSHVTFVGVRSDGQALTDPYPAGVTQVTWTATDDVNDSVATCTQSVTVSGSDTIAPTLSLPNDVSVTTSSCSALLDDELGAATADDNCTPSVNVVRTGVPANFVFPTGTTVITYTATDAAGNTATGTQLVTVHENTPPTINAPASLLTLNTGGVGGASCGTVVTDATLGTATANDNCPGVTVARTGVPAGNNFPIGDTIITYTATDASGNTAQAFQTVRVTDNTPPVITSVPAGGQTDAGSCSATIPNVAAGTVASDNCAVFSKTQTPAAGTAVGLGTHLITVKVTDIHGNFKEQTTNFTVNALQFTGNVWLGLKNSDDVGTKFDLLAEVLKNGVVVGSNQINALAGGSSGFNNAILRTVGGTISSVGYCTGDTLGLRLSVRVAASSGHVSGTARLWYGDSQANSRFGRVVNGVTTIDYLRNISSALVLNPSTGTTKFTVDVLVNRNQGGNPFKPFGTWTKTF